MSKIFAPAMITMTLVSGATAAQREAAIVARIKTLVADARVGLILEGPAGADNLLSRSARDDERLMVQRIAAGCPCCSGNLTLRVTLDRSIRRRPAHIFLSLADDAHLEQLRRFLRTPPYDGHLLLTEDLPPVTLHSTQ